MRNALAIVNPLRVEDVSHRPQETEWVKKSQVARRISFADNPINNPAIKPARIAVAYGVWMTLWNFAYNKPQAQVSESVRNVVGENAHVVGYWFTFVKVETVAKLMGVKTHTVKRAMITLRELGRLVTVENPGTRVAGEKKWVGRTSDKYLITTALEQNRMRLVSKNKVDKKPVEVVKKIPTLITRDQVCEEWRTDVLWHKNMNFDDVIMLQPQLNALCRKLDSFGMNESQVVAGFVAWRGHGFKRPYKHFDAITQEINFVSVRSIPKFVLSRMLVKPIKNSCY